MLSFFIQIETGEPVSFTDGQREGTKVLVVKGFRFHRDKPPKGDTKHWQIFMFIDISNLFQ